MKQIGEKLKIYLPIDVYEAFTKNDEDSVELKSKQTDEVVGYYRLNEQRELVEFNYLEEAAEGEIPKEKLIDLAMVFIKDFHPDKLQDFALSAVLDLEPYLIQFEKKEEKYGLFLHGTGFSVSISNNGQIHRFEFSEEAYQVRYPTNMITASEAKKKYLEYVEMELVISKFDHEILKNGDNKYHLAYNIVENAMEVPVSEDASMETFKYVNSTEVMEQIPVPADSLLEIIGLDSNYLKLGEVGEESKRVEVWSKEAKVGDFTYDIDVCDPHVIKLCYDKKSGKLIHVKNGEENDNNGEPLIKEYAKERALSLLFKLFPDAHQRFDIEIMDDDENLDSEQSTEEYFDEAMYLDESDDEMIDPEEWEEEELEDFVQFEDSYTFAFQIKHNGMRIDNLTATIEVGKYTGKITLFYVDLIDLSMVQSLPVIPSISPEKAMEIYESGIEMELSFFVEYDEEGQRIYSLSYLPAFPKITGHVRMIDAVTGEAMFANVGDSLFY